MAANSSFRRLFQSTLPARGATRSAFTVASLVIFQSTLPARGATDAENPADFVELISIHAPRTGSDVRARGRQADPDDFNPRSPHGERLGSPPAQLHQDGQFQSTLPARGATELALRVLQILYISIHAPRTGSDDRADAGERPRKRFQSTLPARGATGFPAVAPSSAPFQSTLPARGATDGE